MGITGRCVVCLEEKKGGASCVSSETGAPGSSNESPPGAAEKVVHFLCQDCIPMSLGWRISGDPVVDGSENGVILVHHGH